ncbi:serine/threonine protein kinase [Streptomyces zhaozhouensis]|uniref:Serine/threonine protein kinase n=1 Tax=Streptomyces zhaozhouensis TaxID=1300267 RepID=A0A286E4Z8_9ACTN|nr:serine/threonine-protein kinase [Streptomyces zhaozhouensis]SOD65982.1 serine/threonine protein kinase [Streptomyces zhaozhouensis]
MDPLTADDPRSVGSYRLLGRLGRGGMGRVYLGRSAGGRTVAVKLVHPHIADQGRFRTRFAREVAAARLVGGDWTAPVLDADPEAEVPWVATGYVAGPDLEHAVAAHGALPPRTVRALGAGLAEGLAAVHGRGLVHRDVKPSNVLLALDGPRLIDFGIARATDAGATTRLTTTGVSVGSPGYMSPEQATGDDLGPPTDVFSFGAVLAFAAGGHPPFPGTGVAQLLYRVVHEPPVLDGVPDELRPLVAACLAKRPADRPAPAEVAADLAGRAPAATLLGPGWLPQPLVEEVSRRAVRLLDLDAGEDRDAGGERAPARAPDPRLAMAAPTAPQQPTQDAETHGAPPSSPSPSPPPSAAPPARPRRRRLMAGVAVAAVAALALAGGGALWLLGDDEERADDRAVPERYLGVWEGDVRAGGLPLGTILVEVSEGRVGEEVGTATSSDAIGLNSCVDRLTLTEVAEDELTLEAELDPHRSTLASTCVPDPYVFVLRPGGEELMEFHGYAEGNENEGTLTRES